jgi:hypothetical protein
LVLGRTRAAGAQGPAEFRLPCERPLREYGLVGGGDRGPHLNRTGDVEVSYAT